MKLLESTFSGANNENLFYRIFEPNTEAKATILAIHGLGDHGGGLHEFVEKLVDNGYMVYAPDLRGHGKSPGVRGHISNWGDFLEDIHLLQTHIQSNHPTLPHFLLGHSLGGLLTLDYALTYEQKLDGIISISPFIYFKTSILEKILISIVGKLKPDYTIQQADNLAALTKDPDILKRLRTDQHRHNTVTPGLGKALANHTKAVTNNVRKLTSPHLLQFGMEDTISPPEKLENFYHLVGSKDKKKLVYQGIGHRPFDDISRKQVINDLLNWLNQQSSHKKSEELGARHI